MAATQTALMGAPRPKPARKAPLAVVAGTKRVRGDVVPGCWHHCAMVYPPGSARVSGRMLDLMTVEQWRAVEDLLQNGYLIGFSAHEEEVAAVVCEAAQALKVEVSAAADLDDGMLYLSAVSV